MQEHWGHLLLIGILPYLCKTAAGSRVVLRPPEDNCELWIPKVFNNLQPNDKVIVGSASSLVLYSPVQIGVYVTHTHWMSFEGCTLHSYNRTFAHKLSGKTDPIVECYEYCKKATFSTFNGCCFCDGYKNPGGFCEAEQCFSNFSGLCGENFNDFNSGCFCRYRPIPSMVYSGLGNNCLKLYHNKGQAIRLASEHCDTNFQYFGVPQKEYVKKAKWWDAALQVQKDLKEFANETFLKHKVSLKSDSYYWVGTFRKQILVRQRPNETENYCGTILKTGEGTIRFKIKACNTSSLQKLCVIKNDSSLVPRTTTTTGSSINMTRSTDGCILTASNQCNTTDTIPTDQEDGLGKNGVIIITVVVVIMIILIMISLGIFFKTRRTARSSSMMSDVSGSTDYIPAPRNVYISQSAMHEHRVEATPNENGYSEVRIEDEIADSAYNEIEIANAEEPMNTAQKRLRNSKNNDQYDSFGSVKQSAAEQSDVSNSYYDHVQRNVDVDAYDVFERNNDVTVSDYDEMDKLVNNEYDTFTKKEDAATDVNTDYDHVDMMEEIDQSSRTSV